MSAATCHLATSLGTTLSTRAFSWAASVATVATCFRNAASASATCKRHRRTQRYCMHRQYRVKSKHRLLRRPCNIHLSPCYQHATTNTDTYPKGFERHIYKGECRICPKPARQGGPRCACALASWWLALRASIQATTTQAPACKYALPAQCTCSPSCWQQHVPAGAAHRLYHMSLPTSWPYAVSCGFTAATDTLGVCSGGRRAGCCCCCCWGAFC